MTQLGKAYRILGIDPGTHKLGVGCIDKIGQSYQTILFETIEASSKLDIYSRLQEIQSRLKVLIHELKPNVVALENIFFAKNVKSAFAIGLARGVVFSLCIEKNIKIFEYSPTQVKSAVTGSGRADKMQVQKMVGILLNTKFEGAFDSSDAIALAICHASMKKLEIPC